MTDTQEYRTLACGCKVRWCADIREYVARLVEHVRQCEKAQRILIENAKKFGR